MICKFRSFQELRCEKGSVFILVAVAAMLLITTTGVAVDMARAQVLQTRIQTALDSAGLAAGATANTPPSPMPSYCGSSSWIQCQAQKYFNANFPTGYLGSGAVTVVATISANNATVTLSANTTQATTFMKTVGINSVAVAANSQITRANDGMELVLVLDNTGSMASPVNSSNSNVSKIQALQSAINSTGGLLDILYGSSTTIPNMWIGVVPFTDIVNIGTGHTSWMDTNYEATLDFGPTISGSTCPAFTNATTTHTGSGSSSRCSYSVLSSNPQPSFHLTNWQGCVTARSATTNSPTTPSLTLDSSDDVPSSSVTGTLIQPFYYPTTSGTATAGSGSNADTCSGGGGNAWGCGRIKGSGSSKTQITTYYAQSSALGPNVGCIATPVLGMTATKTNISSEVSAMVAGGNTMINLGMAWGFRMLSPSWQGLWGGEMNNTGNTTFPQLPLAYHTALMNKVLILMTDGMNNTGGNAGYIGQTTPTDAKLDSNTEAICDTLKANGVIIYTIGFGQTDDNNPNNPYSVDGPLLKYCATQYYTGDTSHYFLAPTNAQLSSAFQQIGNALANLRVSQ